MYHRMDVVQGRSGDAIAGAVVKVTAYPSGDPVDIWYVDDDAEPPVPDSEVETDDNGNYEYYVPIGSYIEAVYVDGRLQYTKLDVQMPGTSGSFDPAGSAAAAQAAAIAAAATDATTKANAAQAAAIAQIIIPIGVACSDETTALTAGTSKVTFHMPFAMALTEVIAELATPQTSGSIFTVDINEAGVSILSTKLTIDNGEETSLAAVTPPVISDANLAKGAKMTVDIDQVGDGTAKGLKIWLVGNRA